MDSKANKKYTAPRAGRKAEKKEKNKKKKLGLDTHKHNSKAFAFSSGIKASQELKRTLDLEERKQHVKIVNRTYGVPPPKVVTIVGPPKVGKTTLLKSLVKYYTKQKLTEIVGPITVLAGKTRITFIECPNDMNAMIDLAKITDLCLLVVDASYGFEMETFEFLNLLQVHGFPRVMGVLNHLDGFTDSKKLRKLKKKLKHRFWTEVAQGSKVFYLSGLIGDYYNPRDVLNMARFISVNKVRPITWRVSHPSVLVDRVEDITNPEVIKRNSQAARHLCFYGYIRGTYLKNAMTVHIPGCGDFEPHVIHSLQDPCPLIDKRKKRSLNMKERTLYAPMSNVGELFYDKDAVYLEVASDDEEESAKAEAVSTSDQTDEKRYGLFNYMAEASAEQPQQNRRPTEIEEMDIDDEDDSIEAQKQLLRSIQNRADVGLDEELENVPLQIFAGSKSLRDGDIVNASSKLPAGAPVGLDDVRQLQEADDDSDDGEQMVSGLASGISERKEIDPTTGRIRRKVLFGGKDDTAVDDDDDDDADSGEDENDQESGEDDNEEQAVFSSKDRESNNTDELRFDDDDDSDDSDTDIFEPKKNVSANGIEYDDENDYTDNDDDAIDNENSKDNANIDEDSGMGSLASKWKQGILSAAADSFASSRYTLHDIVYNLKGANKQQPKQQPPTNRPGNKRQLFDFDADDQEQDEEDEDFLQFRRLNLGDDNDINAEDLTKLAVDPAELPNDWDDPEVRESIRNKFVTGDWSTRRDADSLTLMQKEGKKKGDSDGDDKDDSGSADENDFEDLEAKSLDDIKKMKEAKKAAFDAEYDAKGSKAMLADAEGKDNDAEDADGDDGDDSEAVAGPRKAKKGGVPVEEEDEQTKLNKSEFAELDQRTREMMEGYAPGTYVRIEIRDVPIDFVMNVDRRNPILIGGLLPSESVLGYVKIRVKRHRWFPKILKTNDPLIFSIGWRRFQSIPMYCVQDPNNRHRMLKYTPEHMHCIATFYGPITAQNAGVACFQTLSSAAETFRISATGYVMESDHNFSVVKKLKLTGVPYKVNKNTAFIKNMFSSDLEVAKFTGASIRSVSGLRGQVKKAAKNGPPGSFRATFEDKILMSDIVFLRAWYPVQAQKFYNPVMSHMTKRQYFMRTTGQLRRLKGIAAPKNKDSEYKPITKRSRAGHNPSMHIPAQMRDLLPFADRPKKVITENKLDQLQESSEKKKIQLSDGTVTKMSLSSALMSPEERARARFISEVSTINKEKLRKQQLQAVRRSMEVMKKRVSEEHKHTLQVTKNKKRQYISSALRAVKKAKYTIDDDTANSVKTKTGTSRLKHKKE